MEKSEIIDNCEKFSIGSYFQILNRMLIEPGQFFGLLSGRVTFTRPLGCLLISGVFFSVASFFQFQKYNFTTPGIMFLNAVFMPMITAGVTFIVMAVSTVKGMTFIKIFSVYAYASSLILLISWVPMFVWLTEPWKWILVYTGLTRGCGLKKIQAILIIGVTILVLVILFISMDLAISQIKEWG